MRLIDADNLLKQYERIDWYSFSKEGQFMRGATTEDNPFIHYYDGEEIIKNAPTVDAVPARHGRWVTPHWHNSDYCYNCSECGGEAMHREYQWARNGIYPICPNCGAKMDGGAD